MKTVTHSLREHRPSAGFTMLEIALSLAIIGFALVAIIGVLPAGLTVQKDNREDTVINQDGPHILEAIRNGEQGAEHLLNYVDSITIERKLSDGTSRTDTYSTNNYKWGREIVGLLSTPKVTVDKIDNKLLSTNRVTARVRAMSGVGTELTGAASDLGFVYQINPEVSNFDQFDPNSITFDNNQLPAENFIRAREVSYLRGNLFDLRMTIRWPYLPDGSVGGNKQVFRTTFSPHGGTVVVETNNMTLFLFTPAGNVTY